MSFIINNYMLKIISFILCFSQHYLKKCFFIKKKKINNKYKYHVFSIDTFFIRGLRSVNFFRLLGKKLGFQKHVF